jgi:hypothetical protein
MNQKISRLLVLTLTLSTIATFAAASIVNHEMAYASNRPGGGGGGAGGTGGRSSL